MDELVIVIDDLNERAQGLTGTVDSPRSEVGRTESGIHDAEARIRRLADEADVTVRNEFPVATPQREAQPKPTIGWSELTQAAEARLALRGLDLTEVTPDPLLTDEEIERIERRFSGTWRLKTHLDRYDVVSVVLAATVGAVIDIFFVKIPKTSRLLAELGALMHGGSPTTEWIQQHSVHHDNALSKWFNVPYDHVDLTATGEIIAGSGGKTHRFHTLGHDPRGPVRDRRHLLRLDHGCRPPWRLQVRPRDGNARPQPAVDHRQATWTSSVRRVYLHERAAAGMERARRCPTRFDRR
jgi:hypothetical protein